MMRCYILCLLFSLTASACTLPGPGQEDSGGASVEPAAQPGVGGEEAFQPVPSSDEVVTCTFFVTPEGRDGANGSQSQPWKTFQHALNTVAPGDTVCFRGGVYRVEDSIRIGVSGAAENTTTFIAYPGEQPIFDGGGEVGGLIIFHPGASFLRLSGFTLQNFTDWGLDLEGQNRYIQLDHLTVVGGEAGVHFTYGENELDPPEAGPVEHITLEDSLIAHSEFTAVDCTPGPCNHMTFRRLEVFGSGIDKGGSFGADGIAVSRGYPLLVEDCYIHDNGGDGIDLNSRDREGFATGVVVRRNRVIRNVQNGIKLWAGGRIENNIVWGQGNSALWLGTFHGQVELINNTVAYNMWDPAISGRNWSVSIGYPEEIVALPHVEVVMVNNIFAFNTGPQVGDPTGIYLGPGVTLTEHHNLYFSRGDGEITLEAKDREFTREELAGGVWSEQTRQGMQDLTQDPRFLSGWPSVDVSPDRESPAIDAGSNEYCPADDLFGHPRPVDGDMDRAEDCDLGAIEARSEAAK